MRVRCESGRRRVKAQARMCGSFEGIWGLTKGPNTGKGPYSGDFGQEKVTGWGLGALMGAKEHT